MLQETITTLYNSNCGVCGGYVNISTNSLFTDDDMNNFIEGVESGLYDVENLPEWYYVKTGESLFAGVESGFGATLMELEAGGADELLLLELRTNTYVFSAAKTYQQVKAMSALLVKYKDRPDLFQKEATKLFQDYNSPRGANYLSAEYQSAKAQARAGRNWSKIEANKSTLKYLEYQTVGDGRVRPEHAAMDGITMRVDDAFWSSYYPPNGWRCRCTTISHDEATETDLTGIKIENVPEVFKMNAGKDRIVFSPKHPYFTVDRGYKELAKKNYNLPLP